MNISGINCPNLLDLPNEILLIILNKLDMIDVLYSLVGVCVRLDQLVLHPFYIRHLNMGSMMIGSMFGHARSIENQVLEKVCKHILPRMDHEIITELTVEQRTMELVLQAINHSQLYALTLINCSVKKIDGYLTGKLFKLICLNGGSHPMMAPILIIDCFRSVKDHKFVRHLLAEQMMHLTIHIQSGEMGPVSRKNRAKVFMKIVSLCTRLISLNFCDWYQPRLNISFINLSSRKCTSSTLTSLNICVQAFDDCLYLLDGRFACLSSMHIRVETLSCILTNIKEKKKLPKMKRCSFICFSHTTDYVTDVGPLLRRMTNLQELKLILVTRRRSCALIDSHELHNEIFSHMPHLNKFVFDISTYVFRDGVEMTLPSNEDIQQSFNDWKFGEVISNFEIDSDIDDYSRHHIYSMPYPFENFFYVSNTFPGGTFNNVRRLLMIDSHSFEYHFFKVISQQFPFLTGLFVENFQSHNEQQQSTTLIEFPHLIDLSLIECHVDYAHQFLDHNRCYLLSLLNLDITYQSLATATKNFTNDATRLICGQLKSLNIDEPFVRAENFDEYFPLL